MILRPSPIYTTEASYLPLLKDLRDRIRERQKKSYTVSVGKLTPSKLGNFMEIECWVVVACREGSIGSIGDKVGDEICLG